VLENMPGPAHELARRTEEHIKGMVAPGTLFEELGFNYFGPIDGHDLDTLIPTLRNLAQQRGPRFLHVVTRKGKGYFPAEDDPSKYHGVSSFDTSTGEAHKATTASKPSYTNVFSDWLCDMAAADERLVGITPAMREGSGLVEFSQRFPKRYFDTGIAEQHAVTLAAGMACEGLKPVVAIYSTFLQRAYDQLIHDVALQNLPVLFAIDRAGLVGADGPTHTGAYDISFMRCIPNMVVMTPANARETRAMLTSGFLHDGPCAVRYPRGSAHEPGAEKSLQAIEFGKAEVCREGKKIALLVFGTLLQSAHEVAEQLDTTLVNMRFVKPLDVTCIDQIAASHDLIVTLEDNAIAGGAGSAVSEYLDQHGNSIKRLHLGFPDRFIEHGETTALMAEWGLDVAGILARIRSYINDELLI
jgi:1-deoxy-D-xylulose-5-phosphate synthase